MSFCDQDTLNSLHNVSKVWRSATREARVYENGPINGTTFSSKTYAQHGPVFMPFVSQIHLLEAWDHRVLSEALRALNLLKFKKRPLSLHINQVFYESCPNDMMQFLASIHWHHIYSDTVSLSHFHTENANISVQTLLGSNNLVVENELTMIYFGNSTEISILATQRAFSLGSKAIVFYGVLTDDAMVSLPINTTLTRLCLINEGCCDWYNVNSLQRACPNLTSFSIMSSNLIDGDFDHFNWSLWPKLKSLNLEHNYTMRGKNVRWPSQLEELYVAYTEIRTPEDLPKCSTIKYLSCNLQLNNDWFYYINSKQLRSISVYMREFINEQREFLFWTSVHHIDKITVHHMETFCKMNNVRRACPNSLVLKHF